ncbi:PIN domain-containing protein [Oribacterium sp. WCC10]|uniref:PIN domain-containing protein n=1 Tax=Oribacterium sp. WCC10 TaxID=1855343 RepID=UPI0008E13DCF|nr:PIN domain-containing protein [Oribacterium sp. WCC10]SFG09955.1 hypothetical protein SAMN05216356_101245 [Oribacterium sp. WCC10]
MIILVDFENTHVSGLDGYEYLNENDTLVMYYSDENSAVTRGMVTDLKSRNVHVSLVKLLKQHSNALDMYIASTTGMFLESGEKICIVSKDKGYAAVRDFWHSLRGAEILLGETIRECFLNSEKNDDERIRLCKERAQKATLVESFATMNTIPTRPTLSRMNQRRKNKHINFTEVSEPASLIPNPLMGETPADQLAKQLSNAASTQEKEEVKTESAPAAVTEEHESRTDRFKAASSRGRNRNNETSDRVRSEDKTSGRKNADKSRREDTSSKTGSRQRQDNRNKDNVYNHGGYDGISKVNEASRIENQKKAEAVQKQDDKPKAIIKAEPEKTSIVVRPEKNTALAKTEPKFDPNRVQFVYDPVSRMMKKVGDENQESAVTPDSKDTAAESGNISNGTEGEKTVDATENTTEKRTVMDILEEAGANFVNKVVEELTSKIESEASDSSNISNDTAETSNEELTADSTDNVFSQATSETDVTAVASSEDTLSEVTEVKKDSEKKKKSTKTTASKRRGRTKKTVKESGKETTAESAAESDDNTVKAADTAQEVLKDTSSEATETVSDDNSANDDKTTSASAKKSSKSSRKTAEKKTEKKTAEKSTKSKRGRKPKVTAEVKASDAAENSVKESSAANAAPETIITVNPDEAAEKYGRTANTLHTYYVRLIKAFGKEQGKAVYDVSKKTVQEDIKKRKAAEKKVTADLPAK